MPLGPGSVVGSNIVIERELGHGAMGAVWLAQNRALGSPVAVKVLQAAMAGDAEAEARFAQEARGAAQLDSPHVVKIYDYGITAEGEPFIVMELLRGRDLREHLETVGPQSPEATAAILRQLCRALAQAHERGLIHRDIKPANVFLLDPEGEPFVKVLDFGVAKYAGGGDLGMTTTGAIMGTPYYMSPEQFVDPREIDHRSDLWSAAVVAYGCLIGKLPFLGNTIGALSLAVHRGEFPPPSTQRAGLPPAVDAFFARAFRPNPAERYSSARELADAFETAIRGAHAAAPEAGGAHPSAAAAYPSAGAAYPSAGGAYPSAGGAYPSAGGAYPSAGGAYPSAGAAYPSAAAAHPSAGAAFPSAHGAHPPASGGPYGAPYAGPPSSTQSPAAQSPAMAAGPGYTQLPAGPYAHGQPLTGSAHPGHPHPSLDGTAPPSTMQPTATPRRSGALWLGVVLALFGLGALAVVFVLPQLSTGRSSARDASDRDEPTDDDERKRDDGDDDEPVATKAEGDEPSRDRHSDDKASPGKTGVAPKPSKPSDKAAPTEDKPTADKPVEDKPPAVPEEKPCNCPDYRPAGITCGASKTVSACTPVTNPNACCPAPYTISAFPDCRCMLDACKLPGSPCNK